MRHTAHTYRLGSQKCRVLPFISAASLLRTVVLANRLVDSR